MADAKRLAILGLPAKIAEEIARGIQEGAEIQNTISILGVWPDLAREIQKQIQNSSGDSSVLTKLGLQNFISVEIQQQISEGSGAQTAPAQITNWTWTTGLAASQIVASITAPSNGGSAITGYEYSLNGGTTAIPLNGASPWTLTMAAAGTSYTAVVRSRNAIGAGPWSTSKTATSGAAAGVPSLSLSASASTITLGQTVTITGTAANTASTDFTMFGAVIDGVTQAYTSSAAFSATITPDRAGTMTVQASVAGLSTPSTISVTVNVAAPTLAISYIAGSPAGTPANITVNRAGTVYWAVSTATTMTVAQIVAGAGAQQTGNYAVTGSGPFAITGVPEDAVYYLHAFLRTTTGGDSAVASAQITQVGVEINPTALAGWNFTLGAIPSDISVTRTTLAVAITSGGSYASFNANIARLHYGQEYAALLIEPFADQTGALGYGKGGQVKSDDYTSFGGATTEVLTGAGRYANNANRRTWPTAYSSGVAWLNTPTQALVAGYREFSFRHAVKRETAGAKLVIELRLNGANIFTMTAANAPALAGLEVDFDTMTISRLHQGVANPAADGAYIAGARVYESTPGWHEVEIWGVFSSAAGGSPTYRWLFGSNVAGAQFQLDESYGLRYINEGLTTLPTSYGRPGQPRIDTLSTTATRDTDILHISANIGACDLRITDQFRTIDLTNQNLNGSWTHTPAQGRALRIYKIEAFAVGGLPA